MVDPLVVKDSFLRGSPIFSQKVAKGHPWVLAGARYIAPGGQFRTQKVLKKPGTNHWVPGVSFLRSQQKGPRLPQTNRRKASFHGIGIVWRRVNLGGTIMDAPTFLRQRERRNKRHKSTEAQKHKHHPSEKKGQTHTQKLKSNNTQQTKSKQQRRHLGVFRDQAAVSERVCGALGEAPAGIEAGLGQDRGLQGAPRRPLRFAASPLRRFAASPLRRFAASPLRRFSLVRAVGFFFFFLAGSSPLWVGWVEEIDGFFGFQLVLVP